jgi:hypothetical protein
MSELKIRDNEDKEFLNDLEKAIRKILKAQKSSPTEKLAAINCGVRLSAIRHRISSSGEDEAKGFFEK